MLENDQPPKSLMQSDMITFAFQKIKTKHKPYPQFLAVLILNRQ